MSSEQFSLLFYACMLIDAIGWFGFVALPRIRKLLSCKERADGIVEDVVEIKNAKGQPLFHAVIRYQAGIASYTCETANATKAVWKKRRACDRLLPEFQTGKCICQKRGMDRPFDIRNYAVTCCGGYRACLLCRYSLISVFYLLRPDQHICCALICRSFSCPSTRI